MLRFGVPDLLIPLIFLLILVAAIVSVIVVSRRVRKLRATQNPIQNTSGQGSAAVIPDEIRGWNWGAFLMNGIWAIGNRVWIGLLVLIPFANFIMYFVLGFKGNEWAWRSKKWDSIGHFKITQRMWATWGIVPMAFIVAAFILYIVLVFLGGFD